MLVGRGPWGTEEEEGVSDLVGVVGAQSPPPTHHPHQAGRLRLRDSESSVTQSVQVPADARVTHELGQLGLGAGAGRG